MNTDNVMTLRLLLRDLVPNDYIPAISHRYQKMLDLQRASIIRHIFSRFSGKRINYHCRVLDRIIEIRSVIRKEFNLGNKGEPKFLVRIDDFPRWDMDSSKFKQFHEILSKSGIPYLLGVIPYPSKDPLNPRFQDYKEIGKDDLKVLEQLSASEVEFGMHGITHQTTSTIRNTEIVGLDHETLELKLSKGLEKLQNEVSKVDVFIPAFNSFDLYSMKIISKYFKVICGGPESVLYVGLKLSPSFLNGILYVPSYYPVYGRAREMLNFIENVRKIQEPLIVPLTLHWRWEAENGFTDVGQLCKVISGQVVPWRTLYS
jgi:hypothetical protein